VEEVRMLFGSLQGHIDCLTYQWLVNWQQGERQRKLLCRKLSELRPLHASCNPKVSGQLYHARESLRAAFGERELGQRGLMARCKARVLTTAVIDGGGRGKALSWQEG
jgi:hypothetical protein